MKHKRGGKQQMQREKNSELSKAREFLNQLAAAADENKEAARTAGKIWEHCYDMETMIQMKVPALVVHAIGVARGMFGASDWQYNGLFVGLSAEGTGRGLYSMFPLEKDTVLGEYAGNRVSNEVYKLLNPKKFLYGLEVVDERTGQDWIVDPTDARGNVLPGSDFRLAFINEPGEGKRANCICELAQNEEDGRTIAEVSTTEDVPAYSELLWHYGRQYKRRYKVGKAAKRFVK
jgi:hypothetical protein